VDVYTIGFTQTTAQDFFSRLSDHGIQRLVDVRLNNRSQLAGFAKRRDLEYFLRELCGAEYRHEPSLAPTQDILDAFKKRQGMTWKEYERRFLELMRERRIEDHLDPADFEKPTVLLCSEATPEHCHRRLVLEYLQPHWPGLRAVHL
jgi:uncharacterized protein (DUF488 family)